jgi:probable phosphoglycerate mutase
MKTTIILVRHGQTEWNRVERFRGRFDVPLNNTGLLQAQRTAHRIAQHWKPAVIFSSPLGRAMRTAESIGHTCNTQVQPHDDLLDIDYGQWQGLTPEEARSQWPEDVLSWYAHPDSVRIPGGESLEKVRNRAMKALDWVCREYTGSEIVLVSHTVVNRLLLLGILALGNDDFWRLNQEPCCINVIEHTGSVFILDRMNDTCHLEDDSHLPAVER